jgi:hypothetical protein
MEKELLRIAKWLLKRPAGRRGGLVIPDEELRAYLKPCNNS